MGWTLDLEMFGVLYFSLQLFRGTIIKIYFVAFDMLIESAIYLLFPIILLYANQILSVSSQILHNKKKSFQFHFSQKIPRILFRDKGFFKIIE